jgi:Ca2+-binding RTX toxin-like protein
VINGGNGDDSLYGDTVWSEGSGDDVINGGKGNDRLTGNGGADRFLCGEGQDTVYDFNEAEGDIATPDCENT